MADRLAFGFTTSGLTSNNSQDKHVLNCIRQSVQYRAPARACFSHEFHGPIPYSSFSNSAVLTIQGSWSCMFWNTDKRQTVAHHHTCSPSKKSTHARGGTIDQSKHSFRDRDTLSWWVVVVEVVGGVDYLFGCVLCFSGKSHYRNGLW